MNTVFPVIVLVCKLFDGEAVSAHRATHVNM